MPFVEKDLFSTALVRFSKFKGPHVNLIGVCWSSLDVSLKDAALDTYMGHYSVTWHNGY